MKYYLTQQGREFIAEASERVKKAEDEAREKAIEDAKGKGLSPTQVGKLRGRAVHKAGRKAVEETP